MKYAVIPRTIIELSHARAWEILVKNLVTLLGRPNIFADLGGRYGGLMGEILIAWASL
jgi:hypothetical protein